MSTTDISDLLDPPRRKRATGKRRALKDFEDTPLRQLIQRKGGAAKAASAWGVTRQSLYLWLRNGYVSPERALEIEQVERASRFDRMGEFDRFDLMDPAQVAIWRGSPKQA